MLLLSLTGADLRPACPSSKALSNPRAARQDSGQDAFSIVGPFNSQTHTLSDPALVCAKDTFGALLFPLLENRSSEPHLGKQQLLTVYGHLATETVCPPLSAGMALIH